ncbi:MAG: hypothetical protein NW217_09180 [Hyphomicrobiaceae bacterium]|nr:hypothetical protein [Hyphomicrobiaceae bacterium]
MDTATDLRGQDHSMRALDLILTAWEEGEEDGVPPEMMAYAAIFTAMTDLVCMFGEDAVAKLARGLEQRVQSGEFSARNERH